MLRALLLRPLSATPANSSSSSGASSSASSSTLAPDWRERAKPIQPGSSYPAKEHCSNCGLCDTYYVAHVKDACAFLGPGRELRGGVLRRGEQVMGRGWHPGRVGGRGRGELVVPTIGVLRFLRLCHLPRLLTQGLHSMQACRALMSWRSACTAAAATSTGGAVDGVGWGGGGFVNTSPNPMQTSEEESVGEPG